jgi:hypothetical protein
MLSPLYGQLSPLRIPTKSARIVQDTDALTYISAVETADAQTLEDSVKFAFEDFIVGCKSDGIWSAIKASCILAGARTLSGCLVPIIGSTPTNHNFVSGDYNRKTGLIGNASTKRINTNRSSTADPQNSKHISAYVTQRHLVGNTYYLGGANVSGYSMLYIVNNAGGLGLRLNSASASSLGGNVDNALFGVSRNNSSQIIARSNKSSQTLSNASTAAVSQAQQVFCSGSSSLFSGGRISFYSIGEALDLALLDTRVSNLMTALAAAIP